MAYTSAEARQQMLEDIADAADTLALAVACLTAAYDALDDDAGDALEAQVYRPVQHAYGRLRRAHSEFAARHRLPDHPATDPSPGAHAHDARTYIERALTAAETADQRIAELQDSMLPVEVGDPELRAGLSGTRELLGNVPTHGARLLRTLGR